MKIALNINVHVLALAIMFAKNEYLDELQQSLELIENSITTSDADGDVTVELELERLCETIKHLAPVVGELCPANFVTTEDGKGIDSTSDEIYEAEALTVVLQKIVTAITSRHLGAI